MLYAIEIVAGELDEGVAEDCDGTAEQDVNGNDMGDGTGHGGAGVAAM